MYYNTIFNNVNFIGFFKNKSSSFIDFLNKNICSITSAILNFFPFANQGKLFGYTDQSIDPRMTVGPDDPRLQTYEEILPGFEWQLNLTGPHQPWVDFLKSHGYDTSLGHMRMLDTEHERPVEHSVSSFTTDCLIDYISSTETNEPWFIHASYLRPHPPYSAPGHYAHMYDPAQVLPIDAFGDPQLANEGWTMTLLIYPLPKK